MDYFKSLSEGSAFLNLENRLTETLKPVSPNPAFIDSLKHKLASGSASTILERKPVDHYGYLAIGLGLFAGALIVWLTRRKK